MITFILMPLHFIMFNLLIHSGGIFPPLHSTQRTVNGLGFKAHATSVDQYLFRKHFMCPLQVSGKINLTQK